LNFAKNITPADFQKVGDDFWASCRFSKVAPKNITRILDVASHEVQQGDNSNSIEFLQRRGRLIIEIANNNFEIYHRSPLYPHRYWLLDELKKYSAENHLEIFEGYQNIESSGSEGCFDSTQMSTAIEESRNSQCNPFVQHRAKIDEVLESYPNIFRKDIPTDGDCFVTIVANHQEIPTHSCRYNNIK
jgi:hypothetical protein